jgi:hypothetical protein
MTKYIAKIGKQQTVIWAVNYIEARRKALAWAISLSLSAAQLDIEEA